MNSAVISFLLAAGATAWVYAKFMRRTGSNNQSSIVVSGVIGVFIFFVALIVLNMLTS